MPCDRVRERVAASQKQTIFLAAQEPYAQAARQQAKKQGFTLRKLSDRIRVWRENVQIELQGVGWYTVGTLDSLHDMAVKFVPAPQPGEPLTIDYIRDHKHPKAPKETINRPLPEMRRRYVRVETADGYRYETIWEEIKVVVPATEAEKPVKKLTPAERKRAMELLEEKALRAALEEAEKR